MTHELTIPLLKQALKLEPFDIFAAQSRMSPIQRPMKRPMDMEGQPKLAAVLAMVYAKQEEWHIVMIRRNRYEGVHSDQVSLPGGRQEMGETFDQTALRETEEELGIAATDVNLVGTLTPIYIPPSDYQVYPFVGHLPYEPRFAPDAREVSHIIEAPLQILFEDAFKQFDDVNARGRTFKAPYYDVLGNKVWGATAVILSELEFRLREVLP